MARKSFSGFVDLTCKYLNALCGIIMHIREECLVQSSLWGLENTTLRL